MKYVDPDGEQTALAFDFNFSSSRNKALEFSSQRYREKTNCAAWAFNFKTNPLGGEWQKDGYQPGSLSNSESLYSGKTEIDEYLSGMLQALKNDMKEINNESKPNSPIALALYQDKKSESITYHFLVKEDDGKWTHKPGLGDNSIPLIMKQDIKEGSKVKVSAPEFAGIKDFIVYKIFNPSEDF